MKNVTVTFGIVCRKEKKNQLNEAPLYIRLAYENKRKLISLKEKINVDYWDFLLLKMRFCSTKGILLSKIELAED